MNQVKQTATSLDHAMDQLSQAINDKAQTLADGNYLNADLTNKMRINRQ